MFKADIKTTRDPLTDRIDYIQAILCAFDVDKAISFLSSLKINIDSRYTEMVSCSLHYLKV